MLSILKQAQLIQFTMYALVAWFYLTFLLYLRNAVILSTSNMLRIMVGIREEQFFIGVLIE
ncbi:hypothetical protein OIU77_029982, partial [Salix suchowensis]